MFEIHIVLIVILLTITKVFYWVSDILSSTIAFAKC